MGFINPRKILNSQLRLESRMVAADFGCGSGEWVLPLAEALENGKVYAIDLLEEPLSALRGKARIKNLKNIEIVKSDVEKTVSRLLSNSLDLVLATNLFFQVSNKKAIFDEAKRVLKSGGKILVVEWNEDAQIGPAQKIPAGELKDMARESGFSLESEFAAGNFHTGFIFNKK
jgi:ubiquinone/menaquinone biosynthesis C-methylase UbiE